MERDVEQSILNTFGERATAVVESSAIQRAMHPGDIARATKINVKRVRNILSNKTVPTIVEATAIAKYLDVPIEYLINGVVKEDVEDRELADAVTSTDGGDGVSGE